jgi:hypothetical protein
MGTTPDPSIEASRLLLYGESLDRFIIFRLFRFQGLRKKLSGARLYYKAIREARLIVVSNRQAQH